MDTSWIDGILVVAALACWPLAYAIVAVANFVLDVRASKAGGRR